MVADAAAARTRDFSVCGLEKTLKLFYGDTKFSKLNAASAAYAFDVDLRNPILRLQQIREIQRCGSHSVAQHFFLPGECQKPQQSVERSKQRHLDIRQEEDFYIREFGQADIVFPGIHVAKTFNAVNKKTAKNDCVDGAFVGPNPTLNSLSFILKAETKDRHMKDRDED